MKKPGKPMENQGNQGKHNENQGKLKKSNWKSNEKQNK